MWVTSPSGDAICYSAFGPGLAGSRTAIRNVVPGGKEKEIDISPENWLEWSPDGKHILFDSGVDGRRNIWEYSVKDGVVKRLTDFEDQLVFRCAVSAHEMRLACIRATLTNDLLLISTGLEAE